MFHKRIQETSKDAWQDLVERLELKDASAWSKRLRSFLALDQDAHIRHSYRTSIQLSGEQDAKLYFFEYEAPSFVPNLPARGGAGSVVTGGCMLNVPHDVGSVSLKVTRCPPHKVLEALGASATGSAAIRFEDEAFNDAVTVYARDEEAAKALLQGPAQSILKRALHDRKVDPTFLLGERQLVFCAPLDADDPGRLNPLELLAADLLSLYALFAVDSEHS